MIGHPARFPLPCLTTLEDKAIYDHAWDDRAWDDRLPLVPRLVGILVGCRVLEF